MFPEIPADLSSLSTEELAELETQLVEAFNEATAEGANLSDEDVAQFAGVADALDGIRAEQVTRHQAEVERQEQITELANRVNKPFAEGDEGTDKGDKGDEGAEGEGTSAPQEPATEGEEGDEETPAAPASTPAPAPQVQVNTNQAKPAVTASIAQLKKNAPARTRPREESAVGSVSLVASSSLDGIRAGSTVKNLKQAAEMLVEKDRRLRNSAAEGNVPVVSFNLNLPESRHLSSRESGEQTMERINSFDHSPQVIQAAGGLCAPVNSYYGQTVIADSGRPVRDALANFSADRGGIRFNPPPKLAQITSGVGIVTAAQDLAGGAPATKNCFTVTCPPATQVDVAAVYNCLTFGNFGARAFPEQVEAWSQLALALQARTAEQMLLDAIAAASTTVTTVGLVGAGRELFARYGQAAAGYRSRNRMALNAPLRVLLPAWTLDLVQADFARTFTDETGLVSLSDADIVSLFGVRGLNPSFYLDSKTGGGQVFGAANGGQTYTDAGTTNASTTLTSASAAFTAADIGRTISGAGIPAGATIASVTNATTVVLSAAATATATNVAITVGRTTLAQFPTTVYGYMFAEGSFLHLDAGTLDLGLVRDSTLNSTNQFKLFTETFENVALVGPESLEVVSTLHADGSYAAARAITTPINS